MRRSRATLVIAGLALAALGCPRREGDASTKTTASTTASATANATSAKPSGTYDLPPIKSAASGSSSSPSPSTSSSVASFDRLADTLAVFADDPTHHAPTKTQKRPGETHYAFDIPGVKQSLLIVVDGRPDAWTFDVYAVGLAPQQLGALKPMPAPSVGGTRWLILGGPLAGCQVFRSPDDPSLYVLQSPTWVDAHE
jgi:hypothetical protein